MLSFLWSVVSCGLDVGFDLMVYVLVDVVAKSLMREASAIEEKRKIWLVESGVLAVLSVGVYAFLHVPYALLLLTSLTFVYAQLVGTIDFRQWWASLNTKWDEFEQHEESMEKLQELRAQQLAAHAQAVAQMGGAGRGGAAPWGAGWGPGQPGGWGPQQQGAAAGIMPHQPMFDFGPAAMQQQHQGDIMQNPMFRSAMLQQQGPDKDVPAATDTQPSSGIGQQLPPISEPPFTQSSSAGGMYQRPPGLGGLGGKSGDHVTHQQHPGTTMRQPPQMPMEYMPNLNTRPRPAAFPPTTPPVLPRGADLVRRPIHTPPGTPPTPGMPTSSFRSRVLRVLGLNPYSSTPPGLRNQGRNLCFLNSVLQCLARAPSFQQRLAHALRSANSGSAAAEALVTRLIQVLRGLDVAPGTSEATVVETESLRTAAALLPQGMVLHPTQQVHVQQQQDAAELLTWLFDALHKALNNPRRGTTGNHNGSVTDPTVGSLQQRHPAATPRFTSATLDLLKFIYGDLTPTRVRELKAGCRHELEAASGVDNDSYAEPLQRLADLEWLTYRERNNSPIDDLFTGQAVEAQHCVACNRISVSIQTFNILPVPVVEPRGFNGLTYLDDCFTKFGTVEDLVGQDGLKCECCNRGIVRSPSRRGDGVGVVAPDCRGDVGNGPMGALGASPVLPNGGGSIPRRRLVSPAADSTLGQSVVSPIKAEANNPRAVGVSGLNDSGYQDQSAQHQHFRTSTPIHGGAPPSPTPPTHAHPPPTLKRTDGQRRSLLRQLPDCLTVQLLRFRYENGAPCKISRPVSIPLTNLDLTDLVVDHVMRREDLTAHVHPAAGAHAHRYELYALCLHLGAESTGCGHYVAYARSSSGSWFRFSDEVVTSVNMEYELSTRQVRENAYLLFYRKCTAT